MLYFICGAPKIYTGGLLFSFTVVLFVYFLTGFLFLRFARGARGVEQIPNYSFWKELPLYIYVSLDSFRSMLLKEAHDCI